MKFKHPYCPRVCHPGRRPGIQFGPPPFAKVGCALWIPAQGRDDKEKGRDDKEKGRDDKEKGRDGN
jgi:hypothetical protein